MNALLLNNLTSITQMKKKVILHGENVAPKSVHCRITRESRGPRLFVTKIRIVLIILLFMIAVS